MPSKYQTLQIPLATLGVNFRDEPTKLQAQSPYMYNMFVDGTRIRKRKGYNEVAADSLPLAGTGMRVVEFRDSVGTSHHLAMTTTTVFRYNDGSQTWDDISEFDLLAASWTQVGATNEWYYTATIEPLSVDENGSLMSKGTVTSLSANEWGYDSGKVYIYDAADPTARANGYYKLDNHFTGSVSDRISSTICTDTALFTNNGGSALVFTNGTTDGLFYFEGDSANYFIKRLISDDLAPTSLASVREIIEFWNHFCLVDVTDFGADRNVRGYEYSDIGDIDNFDSGTSGFGTLTDTLGKLTRCVKFNQDMVIYAEWNIMHCRYVGGSVLFTFPILTSDFGLLNPKGVAAHSGVHFLLGSDQNIYIYSGGVNFIRTGKHVSEFLFNDVLEYSKKDYCVAGIVPKRKRLYFFIPSTDPDTTTYADKYLAFDFDKEGTPWTYGGFADDIMDFNFFESTWAWTYDSPHANMQYYTTGPPSVPNATLRYSDAKGSLGFPDPMFISSAGNVYLLTDGTTTDNGTDVACEYQTHDLTIDEEAHYFRTQFITFSSLGSGTVVVEYSTDELREGAEAPATAPTWTALSDSPVTLTDNWSTNRLYIDVTTRKLRLRFTQTSGNFEIRSLQIEILPKTDVVDV